MSVSTSNRFGDFSESFNLALTPSKAALVEVAQRLEVERRLIEVERFVINGV